MDRPFVWQMVREAIDNLNGKASYTDIRKYIGEKWDNVNPSTITDQIIVLTVNHSSRIHFPENHKLRLTNANSPYDILFTTGRGQVEKYDLDKHGIWEIYKDNNEKLGIRIFNADRSMRIYSPTDIIWIKNVTNKDKGEAYLDVINDTFILHFPTIHKTNVLTPKINEIILLRQKVKGVPGFTHLVTPIDNELIESNRSDYRFGRRVKVIAKTSSDNFIRVSSTLWNKLNFAGITQGNACKIKTIKNIENINDLQLDIWEKFREHFVLAEQKSITVVGALIKEIESTNPELTVTEGELHLVAHLIKERNHLIVKEKKQLAIQNNNFHCEVCTFSFPEIYDYSYIECHHLSPIGLTGIRETKLEDLALVCANCHRMLHVKFGNVYLSIQELKKRMKSKILLV